MKVPFYFDRELALEARAALVDLLNALRLPEQRKLQDISCFDDNGAIIAQCARDLAADICSSLDPVTCLEEKFGVTIRSSNGEPDLLDDLTYADYLINEIYEAVLQFAGRLFLECQRQGDCRFTSPSHMFKELYAEGSRQVSDKIVFEITSVGSEDAAMYTESTGRIYIYASGKGMGGYLPGEGENVDEYADRDTKFITRYLVTHELFHILSLRSGFGIHSLNTKFEGLGESIRDIAYQFYLTQEGYNTDQPIAGGIIPLPFGLNNWGTEDEQSVELLNLWLWAGEMKPNDYINSEGNIIKDENSAPRPLGFREAGDVLIEYIEENILTWLRQGDYGQSREDN